MRSIGALLLILGLAANARAQEPPPPEPPPPPAVEPVPAPPPVVVPPTIFSPGYGDLPGVHNTVAPLRPRGETRVPIRYEKKPRWKMIISGLALFAVAYIAYIADIGLTYGLYHEPGWESFVPLAGPIMQFGDNTYDTGLGHLVAGTLELTGFAVQLIGVILVAVGAAAWQKTPVYASEGRNQALLDSLTHGHVRPAPGGVAISF